MAGVVDECHYTLRLLESEAPDDHQVAVETIYGDEHVYISTLPTSVSTLQLSFRNQE